MSFAFSSMSMRLVQASLKILNLFFLIELFKRKRTILCSSGETFFKKRNLTDFMWNNPNVKSGLLSRAVSTGSFVLRTHQGSLGSSVLDVLLRGAIDAVLCKVIIILFRNLI